MVRKRYQEEPSGIRRLEVLFEQMRGEFRVVAESHGMVANGLADLRHEFDGLRRDVQELRVAVQQTRDTLQETRNALQETRDALQGTRDAMQQLTVRFETHEQAHAN